MIHLLELKKFTAMTLIGALKLIGKLRTNEMKLRLKCDKNVVCRCEIFNVTWTRSIVFPTKIFSIADE